MNWPKLLAFMTGTVDQELQGRNRYLAAENRILKRHIKGRIRLTDPERRKLARIAKRLGKKALEDIATLVRPETLLRWHRRLVAKKADDNKPPGRPKTSKETEELILKFARENRTWGCSRIVGALANLGIRISARTVGSILKRHGLEPAPERKKETTWAEFIRTHKQILAATDFFGAKVWTLRGLFTYYCLFFIDVKTRKVSLAGITLSPDQEWMKQIARNITMAGFGFLDRGQILVHDGDTKYCASFLEILKTAGIETFKIPPFSPNLNAFAERFVRSVRSECLDRLILFGESQLRHVLEEYMKHYNGERNHQGLENAIPNPSAQDQIGRKEGAIQCRRRLGGLLKFYYRQAG